MWQVTISHVTMSYVCDKLCIICTTSHPSDFVLLTRVIVVVAIERMVCDLLSNYPCAWFRSSFVVLFSSHHYENSHSIWDHTVLPTTRRRRRSRHNPIRSWHLIYRSQSNERPSWPDPVDANILLKKGYYTINIKQWQELEPRSFSADHTIHWPPYLSIIAAVFTSNLQKNRVLQIGTIFDGFG